MPCGVRNVVAWELLSNAFTSSSVARTTSIPALDKAAKTASVAFCFASVSLVSVSPEYCSEASLWYSCSSAFIGLSLCCNTLLAFMVYIVPREFTVRLVGDHLMTSPETIVPSANSPFAYLLFLVNLSCILIRLGEVLINS